MPVSARILTVLNLKGGVGKTHTTWLLASVCQERGLRVLLVDTDTQGNLSNSFVDAPGLGVEMLLHPGSDRNPLPLIRRTPFSHIDIITSGPAVAPYDVSNQSEWEKSDLQRCFIDPVQAVADQYDYILFDCPPRLSLVSFAALTASDGIVIPMETADWGAQGIMQVTEAVEYVQKRKRSKVSGPFVLDHLFLHTPGATAGPWPSAPTAMAGGGRSRPSTRIPFTRSAAKIPPCRRATCWGRRTGRGGLRPPPGRSGSSSSSPRRSTPRG